jgi:superfamily I DNA/RNA helicase/RecB family exonuclease
VQPSQSFRLVRPERPAPVAPLLDAEQRQIVDHPGGLLRVLAGPGTGKTTTLVESVVNRVEHRGVPIESVLLLTFSRGAAGELRDRVTARLQRTISEPVARTFHSYAFGLVRQAAVLAGAPTPRLLSGSEQDVTLRELFAGRLADRVDSWPIELAAAARTRAFTDELRELLMRAIERDVSPDELRRLGRQHRRPDWTVAAEVLREYLEVTALKAPGAFDAAELIQRANSELRSNPQLLLSERARRRRIFVDEFQDTDPAQIELLRLIGQGADELVLIGDPDQAIYSFRGAEQHAMLEVESYFGSARPTGTMHTAVLTHCRRSGPTLLAASRRVASRLTGPAQHRKLTAAGPDDNGRLSVALFPSASHEAAHIASVLRRAHVEEGIEWSEMAVLVRSAGPATDSLRRGLAGAGVPVGQAVRGALTDEPAIVHLLALLRCVARPSSITVEDAEGLLTGPVGRADPLQLVRMRRYLRKAPGGSVTLAELLTEPGALALVPASVHRPIERLHAVVQAGALAVAGGAAAEDVLWAVWQASGLSPRLERRSLAGGPDGARADRDLDAVLALFAEAAKVAERSPGGGPDELYRWITQLQITDTATDPSRTVGDVVTILTAHASKGREWDVVCVAGVQDGIWPNLRRRGSLLGADLLVDVVANRAPVATGSVTERLAEERRLFYVAVTRARRLLLVTALENEDAQPSRFLDELDPLPERVEKRSLARAERRFVLQSVVAELRASVTDPAVPHGDRHAAAAQLARLAEAGVRGAHPDEWWGLGGVSSDAPIRGVDAGPVPIRPSKFEAYADCELRALLTELGATDAGDEMAAALGTLVHWVAEQAPNGADIEELTALLEQGWSRLEFAAPWHAVRERARAQRMLAALGGWLVTSRAKFTEVAREESFKVEIGDAVMSGKVDRLERDSAGRLVVVDLKTGKNKPTMAAVTAHPQLAAYQLAVAEGAFTEGQPSEPGGALLVQVGAATAGAQIQPPMADFDDPDWVRVELARIARVLRGSTVTATPSSGCTRCPVRSACPAQTDGRQVTS